MNGNDVDTDGKCRAEQESLVVQNYILVVDMVANTLYNRSYEEC